MKTICAIVLLMATLNTQAQKYILLDQTMSRPAFASNVIPSNAIFKGFFPVEKKLLPRFLKILNEIAATLDRDVPVQNAPSYEVGCIRFTGIVVSEDRGHRLDYVITSTCDRIAATMHLSDAKMKNTRNAYFIKTWIKYIESEAAKH